MSDMAIRAINIIANSTGFRFKRAQLRITILSYSINNSC
jgi:hypothetical protein